MAKNMPDAASVAARWASQMGASTQKMTDGINSVTTSPGQAAAAAKSLWQTNTAAAADRFAANVAAVPLSAWKEATITKGVSRVASGAQAAQPKYQAAMGTWLPKIGSIVSSLPPRGNLSQNANRAVQFMTAMNAAKGR